MASDPELDQQSYDEAIDSTFRSKWPEMQRNSKSDESTKKEEPKVSFLQLFRYADGIDFLLLVIGVVTALAAGMAIPGVSLVFGQLLDGFICFASFSNATTESTNTSTCLSNRVNTSCDGSLLDTDLFEDRLATVALRFALIGFGSFAASYAYVAALLIAAERQTRRMREALFRAIMRQEMAWFQTNDTGQLATRLADDLDKVSRGIGDKIGSFVMWITVFLGGLIIGFVAEWRLSLFILGLTPILAILGVIEAKLITSFTNKEQNAYATAGSVAEEVISCIRTVVAFSGEEKEMSRYQTEIENARRLGNKKALSRGLAVFSLYIIIFAAFGFAFWFAGFLVYEELTTGGNVLTAIFAVLFGAFSLGYAGPNWEAVSTARGAAVRVFEIEDRQSLIDPLSDEGDKPSEETVKGNVEFQNVDFSYPSRPDVEVLHGIDLKITSGRTMALVGPSGCGKSTIVQLIQRFFDPANGTVLLDGHDVRRLNVRWLRQHIGVVSQEPVLFATTIAENIRYGREGVTDDEIRAAAVAANAHDFITKLPEQYNTLVGESGAQLSGGQKQRVAIARALVRNPKILLLDEATSALDTQSEKSVQDALDKAREGRTTVVIAHRLSTVKNADCITAIVSGRIVEQGSHDELMKRGDVYHDLVMNQSVVGGGPDETETKKEIQSVTCQHSVQRQVSKKSAGRQDSKAEGTSDKKETEEEEDTENVEDTPPPSLVRIARLSSPEWFHLLMGTIGAVGAGAVMPAFAVIFARMMRVFSEDCEEMQRQVVIWAPVFIYIGVGSGIFEFCKSFFYGYAGEALTTRLRGLMFRATLRQEIAYFDDRHHSTGVLTTRLARDAAEVKAGFGTRIGTIVQMIATLLAGVTISFVYNWQMTLVTLAVIPFLVISGIFQTKALAGHAHSNAAQMENAGQVVVESIDNIQTVAQLTREDVFIRKYHECLEPPYKSAIRKAHVQGLAFGFSQGFLFFAYAAAFRFGAWQVAHQGYDYEAVFIVFGAIIFGAFSMGEAISLAPDYSKSRVATKRVFRTIDLVPSIDSSSCQGEKRDDFSGDISFENVKFCYPTRPDAPVLEDLSLTVKPGETVALVGASGCGKSTCVQLLERFYDPKEGAVFADGKDIREWNLKHFRRHLGLVSQEPILFDCSIRDNIAYGDNFRDVSSEEIETAAKNANIHEFIESLPKGYDTGAGDKGTQLSGGQKQRIAIARALVRNPRVLLLDEATSALDTESEKIVQEALDRAREGRTSIVIAHRLSTIQGANKIVVIENGRIVERGTHADLMQKKGAYYKLNVAQIHNVS
ncbi:ATP-dependent translocase ABCB1-like isoform X2 [Oscarella lobularis]